MRKNGHRGTVYAWAGALGAAAAVAAAAEPTSQELQKQIQDLQAKVQALEGRKAASDREMNATIDAVLRDADRRSQLLAAGSDITAGYDNGFFIKSADGSFSLKPDVQFQFRGVAAYVSSDKSGGDRSSTDTGFEVRRLRPSVGGNLFSPDLTYCFQFDTDRNGGTVTLLEAWAQNRFAENWAVKAGQFKDPVTHEFLLSSKRQLAVDTSLLDNLLGGGLTGYTQGVDLIYGVYGAGNPLNVELSLNDGENTFNTDFTDDRTTATTPDVKAADFGVAGRVEYKLFGDWKAYSAFTSKGDTRETLVLGGAGELTQRDDLNRYIGTVDAQYNNPNGLGLYGALIGDWNDFRNVAAESRFDWGGLAQVSYLFTPAFELFGRYDISLFENGEPATGNDNIQEITVGFNYYLGPNGAWGQRAKFTLDLNYLPNGTPKVGGLDYLKSKEDEIVLRGQFQLLL